MPTKKASKKTSKASKKTSKKGYSSKKKKPYSSDIIPAKSATRE